MSGTEHRSLSDEAPRTRSECQGGRGRTTWTESRAPKLDGGLLMIQPEAEDPRKASSADAVDAVRPGPGEHDVIGRNQALADELIGLLVDQRSELGDDGGRDYAVRVEGETLLKRAAAMLLLNRALIVDAGLSGAGAVRVPGRGRFLDSLPEAKGSTSLIIAAGGGIVGGRVGVGVSVNAGHEDQLIR